MIPSSIPRFEPLRRNYVPQWTAPERAIQDAVDVIERSGMGGDNITHAINLLHIARSLVADVVDSDIKSHDEQLQKASEHEEASSHHREPPVIFGPCQQFLNSNGVWVGVAPSMYGMKVSEYAQKIGAVRWEVLE